MEASHTSNLVTDKVMESDHQIRDGAMSTNSLKLLSESLKMTLFIYNGYQLIWK